MRSSIVIRHHILNTLDAVLGRNFKNKLLLRRNYGFYQKAGVVFIHIPKSAGSAISHALYGQSLGHFTAAEIMAHDPEKFKAALSFAVMRDPVKRAVSAWRYVQSRGTSEGWVKWKPAYDEPDFATLDSFARHWLPRQHPDDLDFVFQPQVKFICNEAGNVLVQHLVRLENLDTFWNALPNKNKFHSTIVPVKNSNQKSSAPDKDDLSSAYPALEAFYKQDRQIFESIK